MASNGRIPLNKILSYKIGDVKPSNDKGEVKITTASSKTIVKKESYPVYKILYSRTGFLFDL